MRVDLDSWVKRCLQKIKDAVKKPPVLKYFNESGLAEGQGDASKDGLGFLLLQHGQPVTSRSGALPVAERQYSQIGKEFLAFVVGKERNHQYVFGKKVILQTTFVATLEVWLQDTPQRFRAWKHNLGWLSTSDKPQAAPSAEAQIVPKQLNKAAVEIWAFPNRSGSRLHSCQSLPSCIKKGLVSLYNTWQFSRNRS